jgi:NTP pyrophosphatase (non-canonical NTP hydrolase)
MTFDEYQKQAITTALSIGSDHGDFMYRTLGLTNEAGEVAGKVKKILRDKGGQLSAADTEAIAQEMGDVLWYLQALADYLGITLEEVAQKNLDKVLGRQARGTIRGSGDRR